MSRKLYIDGDVLVYSAAFAAQKTRYHLKWMNHIRDFDDADSCKAYCERDDVNLMYKQLRKDGAITSSVELLPESVARIVAKQKLDGICAACDVPRENAVVYLSGDGNFRDQYAVTKGYKANRENVPKPHHYQFVRSTYMGWGAEVTPGGEADDVLGISLTLDPSAILATIDKDLNQIPGRHYDWDKQIRYKVGEADAHFFFMRQLLMGDSTDNVPGIPGMGEKKATNLLQPIRGQKAAMWKAVVQEYNKGPFTFKDGSVTVGTPQEYLTEQGRLLWVQRKPDELWDPELYTKEYIA